MSACDRLFAAKSAVSWSRLKDGGGRFPSTLLDMELSPSSRPSSTGYAGPPAYAERQKKKIQSSSKAPMLFGSSGRSREKESWRAWSARARTKAMTSRVAMVRMSAHDTWLAHCGTASTAAFAWMTVSKPSPASERLAGLSFSAVLFPDDTTMTDASHPCTFAVRHHTFRR